MISTSQIIVILVVVLLLFGTKRLRNMGSDLGAAIKGFKKSMGEGEQEARQDQQKPLDQQGRVIDNETTAQRDRQDSNKS